MNKNSTYIELIEHLDLDENQKNELCIIMSNSNRLSKSYLDRIKENTKFSMEKFISTIISAPSDVDLNVNGVIIPSCDLKIIKNVSEIEHLVLSSIGGLICKLSNKASMNPCGTQLTFEDYYNEAYMTARRAVYSYTDLSIKFTTFVQKSIMNKFHNINNANKALSPITKSSKELRIEYSKIKKKNSNLSFDEIVKIMNLNEKQIKSLKSTNCLVTPISQFEDKEVSSFIDSVPDKSINIISEIDIPKISDFVKSEMSDWDYQVFNAFLTGQHGWASEVASKNINPETGSAYSRRAPKIALDRVIEKIRTKFFSHEYSEAA